MSTHSRTRPAQAMHAVEPQPVIRDSDAMWIQRGQRLGEALLASREHAAYAGAFLLAVFGASLMLLALLSTPETVADASAGTTIAELTQ